jgi:hypothetical protein
MLVRKVLNIENGLFFKISGSYLQRKGIGAGIILRADMLILGG